MGSATSAWATMEGMPESSRFAAVELGLGAGAGLEGRASDSELELVAERRDLDSDTGVVGGGPGAGETMEDRPVDGRWRDLDESTPVVGGLRVGEPPRSRSSASQALREGDADAWDWRSGQVSGIMALLDGKRRTDDNREAGVGGLRGGE